MMYHIPSEIQIEHAISKILKKYHTIASQKRLVQLVLKELNTKKKKYGLTGERVRKIALKNNSIRLEIHSREGDPRKLLTKCPVCDGELKRVRNLTIWGGEVTIEYSCGFCGYWTGKKKRIPTRYIFYLKKYHTKIRKKKKKL